jgi:hypothetical protein
LSHGTESADGEWRSETPGFDAEPTEILEGIAQVGKLPVEDGADTVGADDQIAVPKISVDDDLSRTGRPVVAQPAESQLEGRVGLTQPVDDGPELFDRIATGKSGNVVRRDPVDSGQDLATAGGQAGADVDQLFVTEDPPGDGLAVEESHDERSGTELREVVAHHQDIGDGNPGSAGSGQKEAFEAETRRGSSGRVATKDQTPR